jgi:hypothetical protein
MVVDDSPYWATARNAATNNVAVPMHSHNFFPTEILLNFIDILLGAPQPHSVATLELLHRVPDIVDADDSSGIRLDRLVASVEDLAKDIDQSIKGVALIVSRISGTGRIENGADGPRAILHHIRADPHKIVALLDEQGSGTAMFGLNVIDGGKVVIDFRGPKIQDFTVEFWRPQFGRSVFTLASSAAWAGNPRNPSEAVSAAAKTTSRRVVLISNIGIRLFRYLLSSSARR